MRVRVETKLNDNDSGRALSGGEYEAESVFFTNMPEIYPKDLNAVLMPETRQVPALIVKLNTGQFKVQPLVIHNGTVSVFHVEQKASRLKQALLKLASCF